jgi:predicted GIY-YIG superfamily endonuclease
MNFYVYMLLCSDGSYYTGHTEYLEQRVAAHEQCSIPGYTFERRPVKLVFSQDFRSREQAFACERQIKGWSRKKKRVLVQGNWDEISRLSKTHGSKTSP